MKKVAPGRTERCRPAALAEFRERGGRALGGGVGPFQLHGAAGEVVVLQVNDE
jgi:hypothetical protein